LEPGQEKQSFEYQGIRVRPDAITGVQAGRTYSVVPHANIQRITLRRGSPSAHPIIQVVVGAALAASGVPVVFHLLYWLSHGARMMSAEAMFLTFPAVGLILFFGALRRSFYLNIDLQKGRAKLAFDSGAKLADVRTLLATTQSFASYPIEIEPTIQR
jgi:hypothetical protein